MVKWVKDISVSAVNAGLVTVLVGFTSSVAIVFQAAQALGATPEQTGSWIWALSMGMGFTSLGLSLAYRMPLATAWSTAGAAMIIASASGITLAEATGAFLLSAFLIMVTSFLGWFERVIDRIPVSIAAAMLSGILLRFGMDAFVSMQTQFVLCFGMFIAFLLARRFLARYAVLVALLVGVILALSQGLFNAQEISFDMARPTWVSPEFSWKAMLGMALPLYIVTMAAQNVPGVAVVRAAGYAVPVSSATGWIGLVNFVLAPFGAFALNFATITAAICVGREAHEDASKRYVAGIFTGIFYIIVGLFGATVSAILIVLPKELVLTIAGLALLGTIGSSLASAMANEKQREPALITFLVTVSGVAYMGIGAPFWGLLAGGVSVFLLRGRLPFDEKSSAGWRRLIRRTTTF